MLTGEISALGPDGIAGVDGEIGGRGGFGGFTGPAPTLGCEYLWRARRWWQRW